MGYFNTMYSYISLRNLQDTKHIYAITFAFEVSYNMPSLGEGPPHWLHEIY